MTGRQGFALITILWLLILLSAVLSTSAATVAAGVKAGENRIYLTRARWAALSCLAFVRARSGRAAVSMTPVTVDLGTTVDCEVESFNAEERVNPNAQDSAGLQRLLGDPTQVAAVLDWIDPDGEARSAGAEDEWYREQKRPPPRNGPIADVAELQLVRGFERYGVAELEAVFTARGDGRVSVNRAPLWALRSVSVLSSSDASTIVARRGRTSLESPEQVAALMAQEPTIDEFRELTRRLAFDESGMTVRIRGDVDAGERRLEAILIAELRERDGELVVQELEVR